MTGAGSSSGAPGVRAVVFDFDGLILDTEVPAFISWAHAFESHGCPPLTVEEWGAEIGTIGGLDLVAMLQERASRPVDVDAMQVARRLHRDELVARESVRPGVVQWLDDAAAAGVSVAIASSSSQEWVTSHLDRLGLRDRFAALACARDGRIRPKPQPDTYLAACAALGVDPGAAVAVEDSPHGIAAALTAGCRVVAVPNAITERLDCSRAHVVLPSLAARRFSDVVAELTAPGVAAG